MAMSENGKRRSAWFFGRKKKKTTKKKPQTLKKFFPTLKNSQGFAMHMCRYEETIRDYIFLPKNYGQLSVHRQPHRFCNDCKLKPCITIEHLDEIATLQFEEHRMHDEAREAGKKVRELTPVNRAERRMMKIMTRHFGREYTKKVGVPNCIIKEAYSYYEEHKKEKAEEECTCVCTCCSSSEDSGR
jgi:hypothetical protein